MAEPWLTSKLGDLTSVLRAGVGEADKQRMIIRDLAEQLVGRGWEQAERVPMHIWGEGGGRQNGTQCVCGGGGPGEL